MTNNRSPVASPLDSSYPEAASGGTIDGFDLPDDASRHADGLTEPQWQAVDHFEGPLLVLAGPGSGKTRVITRRIARLVERGVPPWDILAITFTNKAANEMAARVEALLPGQRVWVSTFHRFCARLLRKYGSGVGIEAGFSIYDTSDQHQLLKQVIESVGVDPHHYPAGKIGALISRHKNDLTTAEDYVRGYQETAGSHLEAVLSKVYPAYQKALLDANAVDFDDLLLHVVTLLRENPDLRSDLDARHRFILVDEYQDTNIAQYQIVAGLSRDFPNLCVTGDPDQSIYSWRGARIDNILRFESDYPRAAVVRLEQNFRSTKSILRAADSLISHNRFRKAKSLTTENAEGESVELLSFPEGEQEADWIAREIRRQVEEEGRTWSDFAIFYRVNALSREIERALSRHRAPYQVAAGVAFYERAEIKDLLAYLQLIQNPRDEAAFRRVVNTPVRGIGKSSVTKLVEAAAHRGVASLEAAAAARTISEIPKKAAASLEKFAAMIAEFARDQTGSVKDLLQTVIDRTDYTADLRNSTSEQDVQRLANILELVNAAAQYDASAGDEQSLEGFLESASLVSDLDGLSEDAGHVTLMTLHAAKGLEFPVVFLVAVENGLIPHERSVKSDNPREYEEERRLLFVGITRAEQRLYLTQTEGRAVRGRFTPTIPSEFLREMELTQRTIGSSGGWSRYQVPADVDPFDLGEESSGDGEEAESHEPEPWDTDALPGTSAMKKSVAASTEASARTAAASAKSRSATDSPSPQLANEPKLMTGAQLLAKQADAAPALRFEPGMTVRHPRYGVGKVQSVSGSSRRQTVTVVFQTDARTETFIASKCPLQPVGLP